MNRYEQLANIFGVELNEEFTIKISGEQFLENKYRFSGDGGRGLEAKIKDKWIRVDYDRTLEKLLCGDYEVVKAPFKPKLSEDYYYYSDCGNAYKKSWSGHARDLIYWKIGNCFRTEKEAASKGEEIINRIAEEFESEEQKVDCNDKGIWNLR